MEEARLRWLRGKEHLLYKYETRVQIPNTHVKARHGHAVLNLQCCLVGKDKWILGAPWQGNLSDTWSLSFCETLSQTTR